MIRSGDVDPAFAIFARFQQRNRERIKFAIAQLDKEPDWTLNETFEFDREKAPWAAIASRARRAAGASASRTTRCRCMLTGKTWDEAAKLLQEALRDHAQARRPGERRRRVRVADELLRARLRSALQLFLAAQLRGIPHPDEPQLRRHRRVAAARRRLRDHHERHRRRSGRGRRHAVRQGPHHRRRPGQGRPGHRRARLAHRRRGAADPRPRRHAGAPAGAAGGRRARHPGEDARIHAQQGDARSAGRAERTAHHQAR